ncbi:MAG TPA: hypothetical protein VKS44_04180 [Candidatus Acidoferrales bacterium]|nr:hypothetical protein [Candidatus Acidoferrales bacterium]
MQDAILKIGEGLHSAVEKVVRRHLRGFFTRSDNGRSRLVAIDIFRVWGLPEINDPRERLRGALPWMESLTLQSRSSFDSFARKDLLFVWSQDSEGRPSIPYRFVEMYSELSASQEARSHEYLRLREILDVILPYICFLDVISRTRLQLEKLRVNVYRALTHGGLPGRRLGKDMKMNDRVQRQAMLISRLALELDDAKFWLEREIRIVRDLARLTLRQNGTSISLADALGASLESRLSLVRKHLNLVAKNFESYVSRRNLIATYRLQRLVLLLSIVAAVAAGLTLLASWSQIHEVLRVIGARLHR